MVRQESWQKSHSCHPPVRGCASREAVCLQSREPMSMHTFARGSSNVPPPVRRRACEARVLRWLTSTHGAPLGGPRGSVPGSNVSMRTI